MSNSFVQCRNGPSQWSLSHSAVPLTVMVAPRTIPPAPVGIGSILTVGSSVTTTFGLAITESSLQSAALAVVGWIYARGSDRLVVYARASDRLSLTQSAVP